MRSSRFVLSVVVGVLALSMGSQPTGAQTPTATAPSAVASPVAAPVVSQAQTVIALADVGAGSDLASEAVAVRAALLARLRLAYGEMGVVDGASAPGATIVLEPALVRALNGYDLALTFADPTTKKESTAHLRFADPAAPASPSRLVELVDRAVGQANVAATAAPVVALAPLSAPPNLHDNAVAATALLAARLHDASGATVTVLSGGDGPAGATAATVPNARLTVIGGLVRSGSAYDVHLVAYGLDRTALGDLHVSVRDLTAFPPATVFAPFLTSSLDVAPPPESNDPGDVAVLPFESAPELAGAAAIARTAIVDRSVAGGIGARAESSATGVPSLSGTFTKLATGYHLELVGHSATTGGTVTTGVDLAAPALVPPPAAVVALVEAAKTAQPAPAHRFVFVPFDNPSNKDGYINFANAQFAKDLGERGYALTPQPGLDPVDARLSASELCKANDADGILLATHIDHDQVYHKGALRTFGSFLGFFTFGLGNAVVNTLGNVASDDRYVNRANLAATLVDCKGKRLWNKTVQGGNSHYGRNAAAGGSGAISDAIGQLVTSMFAETSLSAAASP